VLYACDQTPKRRKNHHKKVKKEEATARRNIRTPAICAELATGSAKEIGTKQNAFALSVAIKPGKTLIRTDPKIGTLPAGRIAF
jgi:hypothetical protein